jgi:iron complex outermembrane recepter protein
MKTGVNVLLLAGVSSLVAPALAKEGDRTAAGGTVEEVIVTAQKREQNVQEVPISVSAFTADMLAERAVASVSALSAIAPNVTLDAGTPFSGSTAVLSAFIRGIGSDDFAFNIDPGVGLYMDGVYLARSVGANQDLADVERIEILKGPQGTLFGRNTIGGAISIVTRDPGDEFHFKGDITLGTFERLDVRGTMDLPIAKGVSSSLSFSHKSRDGYLERIPYGDPRAANADPIARFAQVDYQSSDREGGEDSNTVRAKLKIDRGAFTARLTGDYTKSDTEGFANKLLGTPITPGSVFSGFYNLCISTPPQVLPPNLQAVCGARGTSLNPQLLLPGLGGVNADGNALNDRVPWDDRFVLADQDKSYATGNSFSDLENWGVAATMDYDLSDQVMLRSITGYREIHWKAGLDADGSPLSFAELSFPLNQRQFSEEVQAIVQALDDRLNIVVGAYYFEEKGDLRDYVIFAEGLLQVDGPNRFHTKNHAFFGQVDFRPFDLLGFTLGGRYTNEQKSFEGGQQDLNGFAYKVTGCADTSGNLTPNAPFPAFPAITCQTALSPDPSNLLRIYAPGEFERKFDNFSPKAGLQLYPADDVMAYASWSRGYKTGGWTTRLSQATFQEESFEEEEAATWEVGIKSELLGRRLRANASVFMTEYDGIQLNFQRGVSPTYDNAGDARIKGAELELNALPTDALSISGSVGYLDAYYTSVEADVINGGGGAIDGIQAGTLVDGELPKAPRWKINLSPRYEHRLGSGAALVLLADWTHTASSWLDTQRTYLIQRQASDVVNASVAYHSADERWTLTVGATNLTDERYLTTGNANLAASAIFGTYNRPREWYAQLGVGF